jgi:hypothetical protein
MYANTLLLRSASMLLQARRWLRALRQQQQRQRGGCGQIACAPAGLHL